MTASAPQKPSERDRPGGSDDQLRPRKRKDRPTTEQVLRFLRNFVHAKISSAVFLQFDLSVSSLCQYRTFEHCSIKRNDNCESLTTSEDEVKRILREILHSGVFHL